MNKKVGVRRVGRPRIQTPNVEAQEPQIQTPVAVVVDLEREIDKQDMPLEDRRFWPSNKPMPQTYKKRRQLPCPKCHRVLLDHGGQAAVCSHSGEDIAWFVCRACEYRWAMAVSQ